MKEINFYSFGDSHKLSTWSNVPYLFAEALEKKGFKLNRIDISPPKTINHLFNSLSFLFFQRIFSFKSCPIFQRSFVHRWIIERRLKKVSKKYPNADLNLFLSYGFFNKYSVKPNVLWCDWTDRIVIERLGRTPQWYETRSLAHEDIAINKADAVFTMFPKCQKKMEAMYGRKIEYLHRNVVNSVYKGPFDNKSNIEQRKNSQAILFIGNIRYKSGALILIKAIKELQKTNPDLTLHIIGMSPTDLPSSKNVVCHGYLHKDIARERDEYYELLLSCKCLVNPTKGWAGYSSCIEAMYYGCPIIISHFEDFEEEFGNSISFGYYCDDNNLKEKLSNMMASSSEYVKMCNAAHHAVKDYTWDNYVDLFIQSLQSKGFLSYN